MTNAAREVKHDLRMRPAHTTLAIFAILISRNRGYGGGMENDSNTSPAPGRRPCTCGHDHGTPVASVPSQPAAEGPLDPETLKGSYLGALIIGGAILAMLLGGEIMDLQGNTRKAIIEQEKLAARRKLMLTVEKRVLENAVRAQPSMASYPAPLPAPKY